MRRRSAARRSKEPLKNCGSVRTAVNPRVVGEVHLFPHEALRGRGGLYFENHAASPGTELSFKAPGAELCEAGPEEERPALLSSFCLFQSADGRELLRAFRGCRDDRRENGAVDFFGIDERVHAGSLGDETRERTGKACRIHHAAFRAEASPNALRWASAKAWWASRVFRPQPSAIPWRAMASASGSVFARWPSRRRSERLAAMKSFCARVPRPDRSASVISALSAGSPP